jgi:ABC-type nitrate/sulfonate/bicarbonate transport system substrate-binding protein
LANSGDVIKRYQGSVGATRRQWAAANETALVGYIRGYIAAVDWLYDPANKEEAMAILIKRQDRMKREEAERSYGELLHPSTGTLSKKAAIDMDGVRTVLKLRSEYAQPRKNLTDPQRYYEPKYYTKALGS